MSGGLLLLAVGLTALLEDSVGLGVILPAETIIVAAGATAAAVGVPGWAVWLVAWLCGSGGDVIGYAIGRRFGQRLLERLVERFGSRLRLTPERVDRARDLIQGWGPLGVVVGRFVPGVRILVMPLAGATRMPVARFVVADLVGVAGWAGWHVALGYLVGHTVSNGVGLAAVVVGLALTVIAIGLVVWRHRHPRQGS